MTLFFSSFTLFKVWTSLSAVFEVSITIFIFEILHEYGNGSTVGDGLDDGPLATIRCIDVDLKHPTEFVVSLVLALKDVVRPDFHIRNSLTPLSK